MVRTIRVLSGRREYPVHIGMNLLSRCSPFVRRATRAKTTAILSTRRIHRLYGAMLERQIRRTGVGVKVLLVPDGERHKNARTLFRILKGFAVAGLRRDSALIVLGGGVLGDLGGMAAALYMRGIDVIQCPTTLLAQVDASVGGKTAIDLGGVKNLVGVFHQPRAVWIDPSTLRTLPARQLRTGMAEVIKHGIIRDARLFDFLEHEWDAVLHAEPKALMRCIADSCRIKADVVSRDEREKGMRAILNYGHTIGHALEAFYGYRKLTHGEAIAWGMVAAAQISYRSGLCSVETVRRQTNLLKRAGLLKKLSHLSPTRVYQRILLDKKARHHGVQFILTRKIGVVTIYPHVPKKIIFWALNQLQARPDGP